jgi:hypothetical protein
MYLSMNLYYLAFKSLCSELWRELFSFLMPVPVHVLDSVFPFIHKELRLTGHGQLLSSDKCQWTLFFCTVYGILFYLQLLSCHNIFHICIFILWLQHPVFQTDKFVPTIHCTKQAVLLDIVVYNLCCHPEFWICSDQSESLVFIHITLLLMSAIMIMENT